MGLSWSWKDVAVAGCAALAAGLVPQLLGSGGGGTAAPGLAPYFPPEGRDTAPPPSSEAEARAAFDTPSQADVSSTCWSESFWEAREKFRELAALAGLESHVLEVLGPRYTIDVAVVRGTGPGVVLHLSGTHGAEGFAGSAVQVAFMEGLARAGGGAGVPGPRPGPTVVLVHAVNPYGMAHFRRFNEQNVDLNRNALHEDEWPEALGRDFNLAGYADFDEGVFNPPHAPTWFDAHVRSWLMAGYHIARHGFVTMKRAIVAAQYQKPSGVYFGGRSLQASHRVLRDFIREHVEAGDGGVVTLIDVHTGLGPSGVDTLMPKGEADFLKAEMPVHFPGATVEVPAPGGGDVAAGYDLTIGGAPEFYLKLFERAARPLGMTQEFGTVPGVFVARAMILENQAFVYAPCEQPAWSALVRDAFYVRTDAWRRAVLGRGLTLLRQAIARSS